MFLSLFVLFLAGLAGFGLSHPAYSWLAAEMSVVLATGMILAVCSSAIQQSESVKPLIAALALGVLCFAGGGILTFRQTGGAFWLRLAYSVADGYIAMLLYAAPVILCVPTDQATAENFD